MRIGRCLSMSGILLALMVAPGAWRLLIQAQAGGPVFNVDPFWPKPLPSVTDALGHARQWVPGEPGATCVDSHDHVVQLGFRASF